MAQRQKKEQKKTYEEAKTVKVVKKATITEALAKEIISASNNSGDSFAISKKNDMEKQEKPPELAGRQRGDF